MCNPASVIRYVMETELSGHNFYKENVEKTENLVTEEILQRLAKIELDRYECLKKLSEEYKDTSEVSGKIDMPREEGIVFRTREESGKLDAALRQSMTPDMNILRIAYLIEEGFEQYYTNMTEKVKDGKLKEILLKFAGWENGHAKLSKAQYQERMDRCINISWGG